MTRNNQAKAITGTTLTPGMLSNAQVIATASITSPRSNSRITNRPSRKLTIPFVHHIQGHIILASAVMMSLASGIAFIPKTQALEYVVAGITASTKALASEAPALTTYAFNSLQNTGHQFIQQHLSALRGADSQNPEPSAGQPVTLDINFGFVAAIAVPQIAQTQELTLSTTELLAQNTAAASPFASYSEVQAARSAAKKPENRQTLATLREINNFLQLKHDRYSYVDNKYFLKNVEAKLPQFKNHFKKAADKHGLDWRLVASIAYQESVWNPEAVSPTGVKGMMMLTKITAKEMGVKDRTNTVESINGGTAYFKKLVDRIPQEVKGPDRLLMALAAYNMGYGHLIAARKLTKKQNADNTKWSEVKIRLPLLQKKKYYQKSKYGYAGGARQALHYVAEIQKHYDMLLMLTEKNSIETGTVEKQTREAFALARYKS